MDFDATHTIALMAAIIATTTKPGKTYNDKEVAACVAKALALYNEAAKKCYNASVNK